MHIDRRNKVSLVVGVEPSQGLDNATITAEDKYPTYFTELGKTFALSLHYDRSNNFLFINAIEMLQFKKKIQKQAHIH